jgi:Na+/H+ antiporter NhaD/arsenite permease-like protein
MTDTPSDRPPYPTEPGPPPGQWPAPGHPASARPRRNGMGTTALVLGVVALVLVVLLLFAPLGAFLGLLAVLFAIIGLIRVNRGEADNRGQVVTGLITGAIALLLGVVLTISIGTWFATHVNDFNRFGRCLDNASGPAEREQCARQLSRELE